MLDASEHRNLSHSFCSKHPGLAFFFWSTQRPQKPKLLPQHTPPGASCSKHHALRPLLKPRVLPPPDVPPPPFLQPSHLPFHHNPPTLVVLTCTYIHTYIHTYILIPFNTTHHNHNTSFSTMGVEKTVARPGNGTDFPKKNDEICVEYTGTMTSTHRQRQNLTQATGWLYDDEAPDNKGTQFDTSLGRGDLTTPIGAGRVIRGWDEGILGSDEIPPMSLGEIATLTITSDYAYGSRGFPGHIPANAKLIFDVELKAIKRKGE
ncbi:hypothetical protein ACJQWK_00800 [Exserohilum turcicum]